MLVGVMEVESAAQAPVKPHRRHRRVWSIEELGPRYKWIALSNTRAILTDAFPPNQRGTALGINGVAAIAGSFLGLVIGGILGPVEWHLVFLVSVPFGVFGTIWAYLKLHDTSQRQKSKMDWW